MGQLSNDQDWLNYSFLKPVMKLLRVSVRKHWELYLCAKIRSLRYWGGGGDTLMLEI